MNAQVEPPNGPRDLDSQVLRLIHQRLAAGQHGPTLTELQTLTGVTPQALQSAIRRLLKATLIRTSSAGRWVPYNAIGEPIPWSRLSPEELDRVRRGEPSTGHDVTCSALPSVAVHEVYTPSAIVIPEVSPPPPRRQRGRRRITDDQVRAAVARHESRKAAAAFLGVTEQWLSTRATRLGLTGGKANEPVSDAAIRAMLRIHRTRKAAAMGLGISTVTLAKRAKALGLPPGEPGRKPAIPPGVSPYDA